MVDRLRPRLQAQGPCRGWPRRRRRATCLAAGSIALFVIVDRASAQPRLADACGDALSAWCAPLAPGGGRLLACLREHHAELSDACRRVVDRTLPAGAAANGARTLGPRSLRACHDDLAAWCAQVRSGGGRLHACLHSHRDALSPRCRRALAVEEPAQGSGGGKAARHDPEAPAAADASR